MRTLQIEDARRDAGRGVFVASGQKMRQICCLAAVFVLAAVSGPAGADGKLPKGPAGHPDLSGYWYLNTTQVKPDESLMRRIPPKTAILDDTGAKEYPRGDYGGLRLTPQAQAVEKQWNPEDDMTLTNACKAPSIIYAMQGPFPIEIYQGTEFILIKLEYFDLFRVVFMDGRKPDENTPHSKVGFSTGHWDADTLVVETTHLSPSTITNNGLFHGENATALERFRLSEDGMTLLATQEFEDPDMLENRGARFIAWKKVPGDHVYPYECDPTFALEYQDQKKK